MIRTVRDALRLVDSWTRRRVLQAVGVAIGLALLELFAFGVLYSLLAATVPDGGEGSGGAVSRTLGIDDASTNTLAAVAVGLLLTKSIIAAAAARWQARIQAQTEARLSKRVFGQYLRKPLLFHVERNSTYSVTVLTAQIGTLANSVIGGIISLITEGLVLLSIFVALLAVDPVLACSIAVYVGLVGTIYIKLISRYVAETSVEFYRLHQLMLQSLQEGFSGIKGIQAFAVTEEVANRYNATRDAHAIASAKMAFASRLPQFYLEICAVLGIATAGVVVGQLSSSGSPYAVVGLLIVAALRVLPSGNRVLGAMSGIRMGEAAVAPLREEQLGELDAVDEAQIAADARPAGTAATSGLPRMREGVTLDRVGFSYPGTAVPALKAIDLHIRRGESVGIVGQSGSGKTTLVDVLLGLLEPQRGALSIDGIPITRDNMSAWRQQVAYVPQDTYLMDASILENVAFYRSIGENGMSGPVMQALDDAMLGTFVRDLPLGVETLVGERGARLSGGQRQRLGIARALLARPEILLLDEATSALDGSTEAAITETLKSLRGKVTIVTIAHRLSTVRGCDRLVLMDKGEIVDQGTFEELVERSSIFSEMASRAGL